MNDKVRKRVGAQINVDNGNYVSVDKITQKVAIQICEDQSVFVIQSADLSHIESIGFTRFVRLFCKISDNLFWYILQTK